MPSPGSRARNRAEHALRSLAVLALVLALWRSARPTEPAGTRVAREGDLAVALARWTISSPDTAIVRFTRPPAPAARDWLVALRRAGSVVRWSGRGLTPLAATVEPVPEPGGAARIAIAGPPGASAMLADDAGALGSVVAGRAGGSVTGVQTSGTVTATTPGAVVRVESPPALTLRRVLVLGSAGWESKFVVAALEERGWTVDARLMVAPGVSVTQGSPAELDTSRYSAVVVLDTTAAPWAGRIARYVLSGGGAILAGEASRPRALAVIAPGTIGARVNGVPDAITGRQPLAGLPLFPIARLRPDAVPLARRDAMVAVAARRAGAGRILQSGYAESWRWRMEGGDNASGAHRAWWSNAVSSVAYAPATMRQPVTGAEARATLASVIDAAPFAHLIGALGDAVPAAGAPRGAATRVRGVWLLAGIAVMALLAEWTSRRLRSLP